MSLRTLAPLDGGDHVKTAVDVQMTRAVRTVSPAAVHNGPRAVRAAARRCTAGPAADVLAETAAGAVLVDGEPRRQPRRTCAGRRPAGARRDVLPLAALAALARRRPAAARRGGPGTAATRTRCLADLAGCCCRRCSTVLRPRRRAGGARAEHLVVLRGGRPRPAPLPRPRRGAGQPGPAARRRRRRPAAARRPAHRRPGRAAHQAGRRRARTVLAELVAAARPALRRRPGPAVARRRPPRSAAPAPPTRRAAARAAAGQGDHRDAAGRRPARRHLGRPSPTRWRRTHDPQP